MLTDDTQAYWKGINQINFQISNPSPGILNLSTALRFDMHLRPITYIFSKLKDHDFFPNLFLTRENENGWVSFEPLSLLSMALKQDERIMIQIRGNPTRQAVVSVIEVFNGCPNYRDPLSRKEEGASRPDILKNEVEDFRREYEASDDQYCFIKLTIENFIMAHIVEIEAFIVSQYSQNTVIDWEDIDHNFKRLLFGEIMQFGLTSLDIPYDNYLQFKDMCFYWHHKELEQNTKIQRTAIEAEWAKNHASAWREKHNRRNRYFYERESIYYRDLFLLLVMHQEDRLNKFLLFWRSRLDYSLRKRENIQHELNKMKTAIEALAIDIEDPDSFRKHFYSLSAQVEKDIARFNSYLRLILDRKIYFTRTSLGKEED